MSTTSIFTFQGGGWFLWKGNYYSMATYIYIICMYMYVLYIYACLYVVYVFIYVTHTHIHTWDIHTYICISYMYVNVYVYVCVYVCIASRSFFRLPLCIHSLPFSVCWVLTLRNPFFLYVCVPSVCERSNEATKEPEMAEHLASIFGTEKDRVNCPFYFKIGACRHGDRCSRLHNKPSISPTLLFSNMYQRLDLATPGVDPQGRNLDPRKVQEHFEVDLLSFNG